MRKYLTKVKFILIILGIVIASGFFTNKFIVKADESGSLWDQNRDAEIERYTEGNSVKKLIDFFNIFNFSSTNSEDAIGDTINESADQNNSGSINPTITPNSSNNTPSPNSNSPIPTSNTISGNLTMYRQTDYTQNLPGGCTIAYAGCGPVSAANIITYFKGTKVNPVDVANKYIAGHKDYYADCRGSTPYGAAYVLKLPEYGFRTEVIFTGKQLTINEAAERLLVFIKNGSVIHAGGQFYYYDKNGDYQTNGHFFVILDIKKLETGDYDFIGLETSYGDRNTIPVNYRKLGRLLYVKHAVAVSK